MFVKHVACDWHGCGLCDLIESPTSVNWVLFVHGGCFDVVTVGKSLSCSRKFQRTLHKLIQINKEQTTAVQVQFDRLSKHWAMQAAGGNIDARFQGSEQGIGQQQRSVTLNNCDL